MPKKISETKNFDFNKEARLLGCKARIGGNKKKMEFQEYLYTDSKGYEIVQKICEQKFGSLISKYSQLHD